MRSYSAWRKVLAVGALALAGFAFQSPSAHASILLNWAPAPDIINGPPEISYTGANLQTGPGAHGNADGNLPLTNQTPGGLQVDSVLNAPIAYSFPDSMFTGGTGYYDVSLNFTGLAPSGPAVQVGGPGGVDIQPLGAGTFTLTATPVAPDIGTVLLTGSIASANISGADGGAAGAVFDAHGVTYTGGVIFGAFPANFISSGNDFSISMTGVIPAFGINGQTGQLNGFNADATGQFDIQVAVPEPTTLALGLIGVGALAMRRTRRRA
jgi:MYXO-CTERM domain-containing protein